MSTAPTVATAPDWTDVLTDLTGVRLAVYDELLRGGSLSVAQLAARIATRAAKQEGAIEQALRWLAAHRLATREASGPWAHRGMQTAARLYAERGVDAAYKFTPGGSLAAEERGGDRRSQGAHVGAHAEVAGGATLTEPRAVHAATPRPAVHAPQFFDFGDY